MIAKESLYVSLKPGCGVIIQKYIGYADKCTVYMECVEPPEYLMILVDPTTLNTIDKIRSMCKYHATKYLKITNNKECPNYGDTHWHFIKIRRTEMLWNT